MQARQTQRLTPSQLSVICEAFLRFLVAVQAVQAKGTNINHAPFFSCLHLHPLSSILQQQQTSQHLPGP